jgi:hypothetical protein
MRVNERSDVEIVIPKAESVANRFDKLLYTPSLRNDSLLLGEQRIVGTFFAS